MVRDIESLIEYLYLKSINSDLLEGDNILVNPTKDDQVFNKICIINKSYDVPDLSLSNQVINRFIDKYDNVKNEYIKYINVAQDDIFVFPKDGVYYFGIIPNYYLTQGPCYEYLNSQLTNSDLVADLHYLT